MIQNEHADCRREIVASAPYPNRSHQRRGRHLFLARNLARSIREFILEATHLSYIR